MAKKLDINLRDPKLLASLSAGMAVALVPQFCEGAVVTVGGDGANGTSNTLTTNGDATNLSGVLAASISLAVSGATAKLVGVGSARLFTAVRSSISDPVVGLPAAKDSWTFFQGTATSTAPNDGALFNSEDNWVPGFFNVAGVNSGNIIFGWLQVGLNGDGTEATIINFTYNDAATNTVAITKPVGGFTVVPEPSGFGLLTLAMGAAGVMRRRRMREQAKD